MCDLLMILEEIDFASYLDDNTPFVSETTPENLMGSLESCSTSLFQWFSNNQMKVNPEKFHQLINVNRPATINIGEHIISNSYRKKCLVLRSIVNSVLAIIFKRLLKKPVRRYMFYVHARITRYMCVTKRNLLVNAFLRHSLL